MILGGGTGAGNCTTLDDLFRRAGVRHSDALALADRTRRLTFAEADRAISRLAARLLDCGLPGDSVIAIQLANSVESAIALMGVLRAGMIAAPLPFLWRKQDMVAALASAGAKAIISDARGADGAMQAAAELFPVRFVGGFGNDLPDGIVALDDCLAAGPLDFIHPPVRTGNPAAHVATVTFDVTAAGLVPAARNHIQLIAGGAAAYLEGGIAEDASILSAIPACSFAGLALTLMPWLISGGTLALHHGFDADAFGEQCRAHEPATLVLPGPVLAPLGEADLLEGARSILAFWRAPERQAASAAWHGDAALTDVACFGETGLIPARRGRDGLPAPTPCGVIVAPRGAAGAIPVIEAARNKSGALGLRGGMVPEHPFPPSGEPAAAPNTFADTGFACRHDRDNDTLAVTAPPGGLIAIGGYRFRQNDVDRQVAEADRGATIVPLPDALLGQRFGGGSPNRAATAAALQSRGTNPLITGAFRPRLAGNAA